MNQSKKLKNILGTELEVCSLQPVTGYARDGYCRPIEGDYGDHLVCATMDQKFLDFTKRKGNDLSSVVKDGENWCLCQKRWQQAYDAGYAPHVIKKATHKAVKPNIQKKIKEGLKGGKKSKKTRKYKRKKNTSRKKNHGLLGFFSSFFS